MSLDSRYPSADHKRSYYYRGQHIQMHKTTPLEVGFGATGIRKFAGANPAWVRGLDRGVRYARKSFRWVKRNHRWVKYYYTLPALLRGNASSKSIPSTKAKYRRRSKARTCHHKDHRCWRSKNSTNRNTRWRSSRKSRMPSSA